MSNYTYMVTNKINGKVYVGSHSWENEGLDPDYYGSGTAIKSAVKKYGKENFQVEVLYYYDTVEECRKDEERILTEYNVKDCIHSYNMKNSAIGSEKGCKLSEETRKKISQATKGKTVSEETRKNLSQAMIGKNKGRKHSEEFKRKISRATKGKNNPMYGRTGEKHPLYGKHLSDEHRKKLSESKKGEKSPNYGKRGKGTPMYGKHHTDATRQKIAQALKGRTLSEEHRQKMSQAMKRKTASKEYRKKMSQAQNYRKIPIVAIQKDTGKIKIFESILECSRVLGANTGSICNCLKGRCKTCKGYTFKYVEELESGIYEGITGIAE